MLAKLVTDHIQAHYQQAVTKPPELAMMLGQPSAAPMMPPVAPGAPAPPHPAAKGPPPRNGAAGPEHRPPPAAGP